VLEKGACYNKSVQLTILIKFRGIEYLQSQDLSFEKLEIDIFNQFLRKTYYFWRHDTQRNDTQRNDTQLNNKNVTLSIRETKHNDDRC